MPTPSRTSELVRTAHEAIRTGRHELAIDSLEALLRRRRTRADTALAAALARRVGRPETALRLLASRANPRAGESAGGNPLEEQAEYAAALLGLGARGEAERRLARIDGTRCPRALLFRGLDCLERWDAGAAIPWLERFLEAVPAADYDYRAAQVCLAAALVESRQPERARAHLAPLLAATSEEEGHLLQARLVELSARNEIFDGRYEAALAFLRRGREMLSAGMTLDAFFLRKWEAIAHSKAARLAVRWKDRIALLRREALARGLWESARELDFHLAVAERDRERLAYLYFGTPFAALQRQYTEALTELGTSWLPESVVRKLGTGGSGLEPKLEIVESELGANRLFRALNRDFYRPQRLAELHEAVHPETVFSPRSSAAAVAKAVTELERHFAASYLPLAIETGQGGFALTAAAGSHVALLCDRGRRPLLPARIGASLDRLRSTCRRPFFRADDYATLTGTAPRTAGRHLSLAVKAGALERAGARGAPRFRFRDPQAPEK